VAQGTRPRIRRRFASIRVSSAEESRPWRRRRRGFATVCRSVQSRRTAHTSRIRGKPAGAADAAGPVREHRRAGLVDEVNSTTRPIRSRRRRSGPSGRPRTHVQYRASPGRGKATSSSLPAARLCKADPPMDTPHGTPLQLSRAGRRITGVAGLVALAVGGVAVFVTDNGVGAIALLVVGVVLLLTAAVGVVPARVKLGDKEVDYGELRYAEQTREKVEEVITDSTVPLDERGTIADLIVDFNEQFMKQVGILPDTGKDFALRAYQISILAALNRGREYEIAEVEDGQSVDFVVRHGDREVNVICALGISTTSGPMPTEMVGTLIDRVAEIGAILVPTNRPPITAVHDRSSTGHFAPRKSLPPSLRIVKWTSPADDAALIEALDELISNS
jgi:hypothetical protein